MTQYYKLVELSRVQNCIAREMLDDSIASYKNWIASAVATGNFAYAQKLEKQLELRRQMCHVFVPDDMWDRQSGQKITRRP